MHSYRKWTELSFCTCTCLNLVPFIPLQKLWMIRIPDLSHIGDFPDRDGWVCIITGPTSGIGKETAREMFQRGYHGKNHWHGCPAYFLRQLYYRRIYIYFPSLKKSISLAKTLFHQLKENCSFMEVLVFCSCLGM